LQRRHNRMTTKEPSVARSWAGQTPPEKADAYENYLRSTGVPELRATPGNQGVFLLRRDLGAETEFVVLSFWDSMDSIRRFAGDEVEKAVYYPADREYLVRMDPHVTHYQVRPVRQP
ncbi:MAG: antibiotic biosynthesis monooxygenase family protein, partial [Anaerolineales bacterium]